MAQKTRPSSAIKQEYQNVGSSGSHHQYGYIQRSPQNYGSKLKSTTFDSE